MTLKNSDDILFRLYILRDDPKYTATQRQAIIDCIHIVKDVPIETNYSYLGKDVEKAIRSTK